MINNFYILGLIYLAMSCQSYSDGEKAIVDYMRVQSGSEKLEIEFSDIEITQQTVQDSINILQRRFEAESQEKQEKMKQLESDIETYIQIMESLDDDGSMLSMYQMFLTQSRQLLAEWQKKEIVNHKSIYDGRDVNDVVTVIFKCNMTSLLNPALKTKQTKTCTFLLSPDQKECIRQLK